MFGDVAEHLLKMMGHSGTIPSAISAKDVPAVLERLKNAVESEQDDHMDVGGRVTPGAVTDAYMDVGGRTAPGASSRAVTDDDDHMDVGGTTPRTGEVEPRREQRSRVVSGTTTEDEEPHVSLANRAFPLVEMLTAAAEANCNVMWNKN
jgi:Domain of unknown function (DUF1840)